MSHSDNFWVTTSSNYKMKYIALICQKKQKNKKTTVTGPLILVVVYQWYCQCNTSNKEMSHK